jgi:hypothetical protein
MFVCTASLSQHFEAGGLNLQVPLYGMSVSADSRSLSDQDCKTLNSLCERRGLTNVKQLPLYTYCTDLTVLLKYVCLLRFSFSEPNSHCYKVCPVLRVSLCYLQKY